MDRKKLDKIKAEIDDRRRSTARASDLERLARQLGRKLVKRGKHPMWESQLPESYALSIPHHGGRDLAKGTKHCILDQLEGEVLAWEEKLDAEEEEEPDVTR